MAKAYQWTEERLKLLEDTRSLSVRRAAEVIGCTLGTLAGKRKRLIDMKLVDHRVDRDDWDYKLFETWEQRKARKQREQTARKDS